MVLCVVVRPQPQLLMHLFQRNLEPLGECQGLGLFSHFLPRSPIPQRKPSFQNAQLYPAPVLGKLPVEETLPTGPSYSAQPPCAPPFVTPSNACFCQLWSPTMHTFFSQPSFFPGSRITLPSILVAPLSHNYCSGASFLGESEITPQYT